MDFGLLFSVITELFSRWEILATLGFTVFAFVILRTIAIPNTKPRVPFRRRPKKQPETETEPSKPEGQTDDDEEDGDDGHKASGGKNPPRRRRG